ncbi:VRR-NUC domain-containing protein [Celerinatantimonas diazotrophica]|uniref:phosphodiesterase I n=1 Tax=Celerinatantimonas diazotrophica TaxID=412034 RepID=A0A4R1J8L2_9GAMM|nr:VRR-NUC domain-containing protein [Celerinatantimonas diazotrophica]TCK46697.1 VRR-NUC domain-containing protein [Celerinatantimonas diazotrophica]CAG9295399.1 Fanconi-associated nuclease 1 [Celerinatantimonas diazotrophica]
MTDLSVELPADYYLTNFWRLVEGVVERYNDLLTEQELQLLATLRSLSLDAQKLYVRMLCRKGELFRSDKFNYPEIANIPSAIDQLSEHSLIQCTQPQDWEILGQLLTASELKTQLKKCPEKPKLTGLKKADLIEQLAHQPIPRFKFTIIQLLENHWLKLFDLLYFNNTRQSLTDFVLSDLQLVRYEHYRLDQQNRLYQSRAQIDQALQLSEIADELETQPKNGDWSVGEYLQRIPANLDHPALLRRMVRLTEKLAREYERRAQLSEALALYRDIDSIFSREREVRILSGLAPSQALAKLDAMLAAPANLSEQQFAQNFAYRLHKKLKQPVTEPENINYQRIDWPAPVIEHAPEASALVLLNAQGWQGVHCENALINGILALTIWPALFNDEIEGVFFHPFQAGPADLHARDFCDKRQPMLDDLLNQITSASWPEQVLKRYQQKQGFANPLFDWQALPKNLLEAALWHIPARIWQQLFRYQLFDLRLTRAGMPDLFIWNEHNYGWLEVKGPNDKLQNNQLLWLKQLMKLNQPVAVCYLGHQNVTEICPIEFVTVRP